MHEQRARAVRQCLREFSERHLSGRYEDDRWNSGHRRVGGKRRRSVAGGCARHRAGANAHCVTDRDRHSAVFERASWIVSFVLEQQVRHFRPARYTLSRQQRSVTLPLRYEILIGDPRKHKLAKSPYTRHVDVGASGRRCCAGSSVEKRA